jgi:prevent-host-death family protein
MRRWQLQAAKARFSELIREAGRDGPQDITVHGRSVAVVVSRELFDQLSGSGESLVAFMRKSPLTGLEELDFERDRSLPRTVDL